MGKVLALLDQLYDFSAYDGVHFDVLPNMGDTENYSPDWPLSRTEMGKCRQEIAKHYYAKSGKIVSGEGHCRSLVPFMHIGTNREWVIPCYDIEARGFGTRRVPDIYCRSPFIGGEKMRADIQPIPFRNLVFHDCIFSTSWEHANYNDHPRYGHGIPHRCLLHDLLYGDMPSIFLEGGLYSYINPRGSKAKNYFVRHTDAIVQQSIPLARQAADWHREVGLEPMVHHGFLDEDGLVQESVFDNGRRVIVNFGSEPFPASPRTTLEPESFITE